MAKIVTIPNPILREKSKEVVVDKKILDLVKELKKTLVNEEGKTIGVGISAVQIGIPKRVFIAYSKASRNLLIFINPEIIWYGKRLTKGIPDSSNKLEGCLSVPGLWSLIKRAKTIKIKYQTISGTPQVRKFSDQVATIIQHEYDHLNGILFIDRVLEQKSKIYELKKDEEGKEELVEVKV